MQKACIGKTKVALGTWKPLADNYETAWQTLERKYDDNYRIKQALIDELFRLPRCVEETFDNLRKIIDTATSMLRQLDTMGEQTEHWDIMVMNVLLGRLPPNTIDSWEQRRSTDQQPTLDKFLEFLEGKARGKISAGGTNRERERDRERRPNRYEQANGSARTFNEPKRNWPKPAEAQTSSGKPACKQCNADHALFRCPVLLSKTLEQRKKFVADNKLCENCLRMHAGNCFYSGCPRCNYDKHNSILCSKAAPGPTVRSTVHAVAHKRQPQQTTEARD